MATRPDGIAGQRSSAGCTKLHAIAETVANSPIDTLPTPDRHTAAGLQD